MACTDFCWNCASLFRLHRLAYISLSYEHPGAWFRITSQMAGWTSESVRAGNGRVGGPCPTNYSSRYPLFAFLEPFLARAANSQPMMALLSQPCDNCLPGGIELSLMRRTISDLLDLAASM